MDVHVNVETLKLYTEHNGRGSPISRLEWWDVRLPYKWRKAACIIKVVFITILWNLYTMVLWKFFQKKFDGNLEKKDFHTKIENKYH
jgi:hypothetical protein